MCKTRPTLRKTVVNFQNKTEKTLKASGKEKKKNITNRTKLKIRSRSDVSTGNPQGRKGKGPFLKKSYFGSGILYSDPLSFNFVVKVKLGQIRTQKGHPETLKSSQNSLSPIVRLGLEPSLILTTLSTPLAKNCLQVLRAECQPRPLQGLGAAKLLPE